MANNPYDSPDFARTYVMNEVDRTKNRYEWEVTHPATLQFLDESVNAVLDYGCGSGIFTAGIHFAGRSSLNSSMESTGTDASSEMLGYAEMLNNKVEGVRFQQWDAAVDESALQSRTFDRVFAKLVLNYVTQQDLRQTVMPRLRECLDDKGIMVAVLPNPLREAAYRKSNYVAMNKIDVNVGNFGAETSTQSYHHTYEDMITAADQAGFAYGKVLGLPDVRFEPYRRQLMTIAHPMPMIFDTLNAAKRWVYVFGATKSSAENFDNAVARFMNWRTYHYPEIADRAHMRTPIRVTDDTDLPVNLPHDALYDYVDMTESVDSDVITIGGGYAEHLTPKQKIKIAKQLSKRGIRQSLRINDVLVSV
jgi:SAM-dependent methyltransferase